MPSAVDCMRGQDPVLVLTETQRCAYSMAQVCDTVSELAGMSMETTGWPELLPFLSQAVQSGEPRMTEAALLVFAQLAGHMMQTLLQFMGTLHQVGPPPCPRAPLLLLSAIASQRTLHQPRTSIADAGRGVLIAIALDKPSARQFCTNCVTGGLPGSAHACACTLDVGECGTLLRIVCSLFPTNDSGSFGDSPSS